MLCHTCNREIEYNAVCPYCGTRMLREPLPHHLPVGTVIDDRYKVMGVLGEGGFGITYLGFNQRLGLPVAIKEFFPQGVTYRDMQNGKTVYIGSENNAAFFNHGKERFLSEAKTLVRFNSEPGIVSVLDFVDENNTAYLIMEYLDGETLQQYLKTHGTLSADEAFSMLEPMMRTLEKVHKVGIIHRDISPDNIMMLRDGSLKLMDFGAAKEYDSSQSMSIMLKKGYAPEEQYRRKGEQGPWTDVYALCATIYRCITGTTPPDSLDRMSGEELKKPSELGADIPPAYESLLMYGMALHQKDRCQNMTELLSLLDKTKKAVAKKPVIQTAIPKERKKADPYATRNAEEPPIIKKSIDDEIQTKEDLSNEKNKPKKKTGILIAIISIVLVAGIVMAAVLFREKGVLKHENTGKDTDEINTPIQNDKQNETEQPPTEINSDADHRWTDITAISAGYRQTIGLSKNGTISAVGNNKFNQCNVEGWTGIAAVSAGYFHTVGLKKDGTVIAVGYNDKGQCDISDWTNITAISAGYKHTVGLKNDGTVIASGNSTDDDRCQVEDWTGITSISAGGYHTVGLKEDGTVVAVGDNQFNQIEVNDWTDIIAISAGDSHTVGLKKDGTVIATGLNSARQCNVEEWEDIIAVSAGVYHTVGLKKDGTVVAVGLNDCDQCSIDNWSDIIAVSTGYKQTIGLKNDGTVVAAGDNDDGQCDVYD